MRKSPTGFNPGSALMSCCALGAALFLLKI
jgi:hypothetical protein